MCAIQLIVRLIVYSFRSASRSRPQYHRFHTYREIHATRSVRSTHETWLTANVCPNAGRTQRKRWPVPHIAVCSQYGRQLIYYILFWTVRLADDGPDSVHWIGRFGFSTVWVYASIFSKLATHQHTRTEKLKAGSFACVLIMYSACGKRMPLIIIEWR